MIKNLRIQFKQLIKLSIPSFILIILAQFGNLSLVLQSIHNSKSEIFEVIVANPLNLYLFPLIFSLPLSLFLQIKKRNNAIMYEYFRVGKKAYFRDIFISSCLINFIMIIIGNLVSLIMCYLIYRLRPDLMEFQIEDTVTMLKFVRTSLILTTLFYIAQQWFVSIFIVLFNIVVNLATDNMFLGFFASTMYLIINESSFIFFRSDFIDLTLVSAYMPGIKMYPFPQNILQLEFGLIPFIATTVLIYFFTKDRIKEI